MEVDKAEAAKPVLPTSNPPSDEKAVFTPRLCAWIGINVVATVSIVYVNKTIFNDIFAHCQSTFVAFHFFVTGLTLWTISRPAIGLFKPAAAPVSPLATLPLAAVMCANVLLMNLSLAASSIVFYQIVRILLSPLTALINFALYGSRVSATAVAALLLACLGVGIVSYSETKPDANAKSTSPLGAAFAFAAVFTSAMYTIWVGRYHKSLALTSPQLLLAQVPTGAAILVGMSFFTDTYPDLALVTRRQCAMVLLSGLLACLVNVSQFFIVDAAGPVSSTVVGHMKTCLIVGLGWITAAKAVSPGSFCGVAIAIGGIFLYSWKQFTQ